MNDQIQDLKTKIQAETDFFLKMELEDELYDLEVKAGVRKPRSTNSNQFGIECVGCGS